jgi:hypothetical protein
MTTFTDTQGRKWDVRLDVAAVRRVRDQAGVDLLNLSDESTLHRLVYDPMGLAAVLWALLEPAAQAAGVTEEQFAAGLGGDALTAATDALLESVVGFFRPAQRRVLQAAISKMGAFEEQQAARLIEQTSAIDLDQALASTRGS